MSRTRTEPNDNLYLNLKLYWEAKRNGKPLPMFHKLANDGKVRQRDLRSLSLRDQEAIRLSDVEETDKDEVAALALRYDCLEIIVRDVLRSRP